MVDGSHARPVKRKREAGADVQGKDGAAAGNGSGGGEEGGDNPAAQRIVQDDDALLALWAEEEEGDEADWDQGRGDDDGSGGGDGADYADGDEQGDGARGGRDASRFQDDFARPKRPSRIRLAKDRTAASGDDDAGADAGAGDGDTDDEEFGGLFADSGSDSDDSFAVRTSWWDCRANLGCDLRGSWQADLEAMY